MRALFRILTSPTRTLLVSLAIISGSCLALVGVVQVVGGAPLAEAHPVRAGNVARATGGTGVSVSLGYADSLRANPTHFPSPWAGSPNVIFEGCEPTASCTYDGGAIEITNTGVSAHTINSVVVKLDTCEYAIWPANIALPAGDALILAQITSGATSGCTTDGRFDTSDVGPNGASWSGTCTQSGIQPVVTITIDSTAQTFSDSGQILNTKGVDAAECGVGNESTQWTPIGQVGCPSATLSLTPDTQWLAVDTQAGVTATLTNSCGNPLQNVTIDFKITAGPNANLTGSATTDAQGKARFHYTSKTLGTDSIDASVSNPAGTIASSGAVSVVWVNRAVVTVSSATDDYHDAAHVSATLATATGAPLASEPITFTIGTQTCGPVKTSHAGVATCDFAPAQPAGTYPLVAAFSGNSSYGSVQGKATFAITHEETTVRYTGPTQLAQGQAVILSGTLSEDNATPIAGRTLTLSDGAESCTGQTDGSGAASCTLQNVSVSADAAITLSAAFTGDAYYVAAKDSQPGEMVTPGRSGDGSTDTPLTATGATHDASGSAASGAKAASGLDTPVSLPLFGSSPLWLVVLLAVLGFALVGGGAVVYAQQRKAAR